MSKIVIETVVDKSGIDEFRSEVEKEQIKAKLQIEPDEQQSSEKVKQLMDELVDTIDLYRAQLKYPIQIEGASEQALADTRLRIMELKNEIESLTGKKIKLDFKEPEQSVKRMDLGLKNIITKVGKWGLALFGIRSAYSFLTTAANRLAGSNKQIGADLEYIKWALAKTLEPVIKRIIQWGYKLLQILNYLVYGITGVNLFANASAKAFEKQKSAMQGTAKAAKQLQKTIAGFDEMNIVQDTGATSFGGGGGGLPTDDLSNFNNISEKVKETLDGIIAVLKPIYDTIVKIIEKLGGVGPALSLIMAWGLGSKLAGLLGKVGGAAGAGASGLLGLLNILGLLVADIWLIQIAWEGPDGYGVKNTLEDNEKLIEQHHAIGDSISDNSKKWKENSKAMVDNVKSGKASEEQTRKVVKGLLNNIKANKELDKSLTQNSYDVQGFEGAQYKLDRAIFTVNGELSEDIQKLKELREAGLLTQDEIAELDAIYNQETETLRNNIAELKKLRDNYSDNERVSAIYNKQIEDQEKKLDKLATAFGKSTDKGNELGGVLKQFPKDVNTTIKVDADTKKARESLVDLLEDVKSAGVAGALHISNIMGAIKKIKYAKGGIVNMPGKGVPLAVGGERGPEGVVPLTDSQQMALLGEAIAKYVNINATITNTINGRVLNRELQKLKNEDNFAGNL